MILYTKDSCSRCTILKEKLESKNISYDEISDEKLIEAKGINFLPVLEIDGKLLEFGNANDYINSL